jgi:hypothetical protein
MNRRIESAVEVNMLLASKYCSYNSEHVLADSVSGSFVPSMFGTVSLNP